MTDAGFVQTPASRSTSDHLIASNSPRLAPRQQQHQQELPGPVAPALQRGDQALQLAVLRIALAMLLVVHADADGGVDGERPVVALAPPSQNIARTAANVRFAATGLSAMRLEDRAHVPALDRLDLHGADRAAGRSA